MELKTHFENLKEITLYLFAFFCCFPQKISSAFFILFGVVYALDTLLKLATREPINFSFNHKNTGGILLFSLALLGLATALYAQEPQHIFKATFGARLSLLLIPIIATINTPNCHFKTLLRFFIVGNFVFILFSLAYVCWKYWISIDILLYNNFLIKSTIVFGELIHRSYSNMNILFCLVGLYYLYANSPNKLDHTLIFLFIPFAISFFVLNNSRAESLALVGLVLLLVIKLALKSMKTGLSTLAIFIFCIISAFYLLPKSRIIKTVRDTIQTEEKAKDTSTSQNDNETLMFEDPRAIIWECASNIVKEHPILGVGVGNSYSALSEEYQKLYSDIINKQVFVADSTSNAYKRQSFITNAFAYDYNCHNQFLESTVEYGFLGGIVILVIIISMPLFCETKERIFYLPIAFILLVSFAFESMLSRYSGCISLGFILLSCGMTRKEEKNELLSQHLTTDKASTWMKRTGIVGICLATLFGYTAYQANHLEGKFFISSSLFSDKNGNYDFRNNPYDNFIQFGKYYFYHFFAISELTVNQKGTLSVECFVSEDFDGETVRILGEGPKGYYLTHQDYNLLQKGTWQTLTVEVPQSIRTCFMFNQIMHDDTQSDFKGTLLLRNPQFTIQSSK